jgi:REP element-mobilizing transposase RayT
MAEKKETWGGRRLGAGRLRHEDNLRDPKHAKRPTLSPDHPVHVIVRPGWWIDRLRNGRAYDAIRTVLFAMLGDADFRVCHISIQHKHIHLIVEAKDEAALSAGMQRFTSSVARAFNNIAGLRGRVFPHRYTAKQIRTARYARSAIAYVLNNWRRHNEHLKPSEQSFGARLDRYASGITFDGWAGIEGWLIPPDYEPLPVATPQTWLLTEGWRAYGEIDTCERPGPI